MPIIKSAKKKLRQDKKRTQYNNKHRSTLDKVVNAFKKLTGAAAKKQVSVAYSAIDKAKKKHIIHANTAARLKARVTRLANSK